MPLDIWKQRIINIATMSLHAGGRFSNKCLPSVRSPLALALNPLHVWLPKSVVHSISFRRPQRAWGGRAGLGIEKRTNTVERHNGDRHPKAGRALGQGSSDPSWVHAGCRATNLEGKGQGQLASAGPEPPNPLLPLPQGKDDQSLGRGLYTDEGRPQPSVLGEL